MTDTTDTADTADTAAWTAADALAWDTGAAFHSLAEMITTNPALARLAVYPRHGMSVFYVRSVEELELVAEAAVRARMTIAAAGDALHITSGPVTFDTYTDHASVTAAQVRAVVTETLRPAPDFDWTVNGTARYVTCLGCGKSYGGPDLPHGARTRWSDSHDCDHGRIHDPEQAHTHALGEQQARDIVARITDRCRAELGSDPTDPAVAIAVMGAAIREALHPRPTT